MKIYQKPYEKKDFILSCCISLTHRVKYTVSVLRVYMIISTISFDNENRGLGKS